MNRRVYLTVGVGAMASLAGCFSSTDDGSNGGSNDAGDDATPVDPIGVDPGPFDDFEDLDAWSVEDGSLSADEDHVYTGSQSARMHAGRSDDRVMIKREFDTPRDLSTEHPTLALRSDHDVNPVVQLTDTDGDRLLLQCSLRADGPFVHHNLGVVDVVGDPNLGSIAHTKISAWAGDRELSIWCDDYQFVGQPDRGTVSIQFPEATSAVAEVAAPRLEEAGLPATVFVATDYVGSDGYLSVSELEELHDAGWTVASAGATGTDLTGHDADAQAEELARGADWLDAHGFSSEYYSYGLNRYDESALDRVEEYHDLAFVGGYAGHANLGNPHLAPRAFAPAPDDAEQLLAWTAEKRLVTTLAYRNPDESLDRLESTLSTLADLTSAGDVDVVTPDAMPVDSLH